MSTTTNLGEHVYAELRKYAKESNATLSDADKDKAIIATVANFVYKEFGHTMGNEAWAEYVAGRSKHFPVKAR